MVIALEISQRIIVYATSLSRSLLRVFLLFASVVFLSSCLGTIDTAIHLKLMAIDADGELYEDCNFLLKDESEIIFDVKGPGDFTFFKMTPSFSQRNSILEVLCKDGSRMVVVGLRGYDPGQNGLLDLGKVVINRAN